jgi:hypothetical protein
LVTRARLGVLALAIGLAGAAGACIEHNTKAAFPLYPAPRREPDQVAILIGPIATVDGVEVPADRSSFELLPRCHVITTQTKLLAFDPSTTNNPQGEVVGTLPRSSYAIYMQAGHTYAIERQVQQIGGNSATVNMTARDVAANGQTVNLSPARSSAEVAACQAPPP